MRIKLNIKQFINRAKEVHGDKYDYSLSKYIGNKDIISIVCKKHGVFEQKANIHLSGSGCQECGKIKNINSRTKKHDDFLKELKNKCKYYKNNELVLMERYGGTDEKILCNYRLGLLMVSPKRLLLDYEPTIQSAVDKNIYFKNEACEKHGSKYNYDLVDYKGSKKKIKIICLKHGEFHQTPFNHLQGQGCKKCAIEKTRKIPQNLEKLAKRTKSKISFVYWRKTYTENSMVYDILGCDWQTFKEHLENNEFGFRVEQKNIDLDHIIPISSAKTEQEVYKLNHYSNFQLLPSYYNKHVKAAKSFNIDHFKKWYKNNQYANSTT